MKINNKVTNLHEKFRRVINVNSCGVASTDFVFLNVLGGVMLEVLMFLGGSVAGTFWMITLSGKFSFYRANRLTPPHSKPLRYGPVGELG